MKHLFTILLVCVSAKVYTQLSPAELHTIDSLKNVIKNSNHDSIRVNAFIEWDNMIWYYDAELDFDLNKKIDSICEINLQKKTSEIERTFFLKKRAFALNSFGNIYFDQGNFPLALKSHMASLEIKEKLGYQHGIAASCNNIGNVYSYQGDFDQAINYYMRALKIIEKSGDESYLGDALNNIGVLYKEQEEFDQALLFFNRSLKVRQKQGDQATIAGSLNNIGMVKMYLYNCDSALTYFHQSLDISKLLKDKKSIATAMNNMAICYKEMGDYDTALEFYLESLKIEREYENQYGISLALNNIARVFYAKKEYAKSIRYNKEALAIAENTGGAVILREASFSLYENYKAINKYKDALKMYEQYIALRDSMLSENNQKEMIAQEYKYKYEKQAMADSVKNAETQKVTDALLLFEQEENMRRKQQSYFLFGGLILTIVFGGFITNRFIVTKKQKVIIETQKMNVDKAFGELEKKNLEIRDSITYAKRIQSAILPPDKIIKEYLKDSLIIYKPKDIVAGDFYWMEHLDTKILFAAADCTGHGVPGAMVSVVCNNALNRSVREYNLSDPGAILDRTRKIVLNEFEKSDKEVKDGMDIALCVLDGKRLQYAGANNPLWIIRDGEIIETKADKQPIGKYDYPFPYTTHTFTLQKNDVIYIFSDGYVDQFGGEFGKKLKKRAFKNLLLSIQHLTMDDQKIKINETFEDWKRDAEQVDDVCIIGVKVS